jgi:response regulator of citrate/malate metabolism
MAFVYNEFSNEVQSAPKKAFGKLQKLFRDHNGSTTEVAKALGVNRTTIHRWLARFESLKLGDPRDGLRGTAGRRPRDPAVPR